MVFLGLSYTSLQLWYNQNKNRSIVCHYSLKRFAKFIEQCKKKSILFISKVTDNFKYFQCLGFWTVRIQRQLAYVYFGSFSLIALFHFPFYLLAIIIIEIIQLNNTQIQLLHFKHQKRQSIVLFIQQTFLYSIIHLKEKEYFF
jgi:hypothetical protein